MLKFIVAVVVAVFAVFWVINYTNERAVQAGLDQQQEQLLERLSAIKGPAVTRLVSQWREAYPKPDSSVIKELQAVVELVRANPESAGSFTTEAIDKERRSKPFEPVFGWGSAKPGIPSTPAAAASSS